MATDISMTLVQSDEASDEIREMYCEECEKHDNIHEPAEGFCVECVEYKCAMCIRFHTRHYHNHPLQDKDSMPQDFYFEKCTYHSKELIKFYCSKCEKLACAECKRNGHQNCHTVEHLPKLVKDIEHSTELQDLKENLDKVSIDMESIKTQIETKTELAANLESKAKATIKEHKEELISTYRQHQKELIEQFDKKMEETIAKLKSERKELLELTAEKQTKFENNLIHSETDIAKRVEDAQKTLESMKAKNTTLTYDFKQLSADLTQAEVSGQKCKLFLAMKDAQENLEKLEKKIQDLQNLDIQNYVIEPLHREVSPETLESQTSFFSFNGFNSTIWRTATFVKEINCKHTRLSSLCLLSEHKLIQTDYDGNCLNILNTIHTNIESYNTMIMPFGPWAITKFGDNKVAVTFPNKGIVKLITFSESMTIISTDDITVGAECRGIAYSNNNLIVSYTTNPGKVQILDMSGNVLKCFDKDCDDQSLFKRACYLTLSPDYTTIYVSDWDRCTVTSMTLDGKVNATYWNDQLRGPHHMTVDEFGTVYVCGVRSDNVHQLSSDLTKVKILFDSEQGIDHPVSVAYCQKNSRLYVGMMNNSIIEVFNLST